MAGGGAGNKEEGRRGRKLSMPRKEKARWRRSWHERSSKAYEEKV